MAAVLAFIAFSRNCTVVGRAALQVARKVVGDHHAGIDVAAADGVAELVDGEVVARQLEALALGQGRRSTRGSPACGCRRRCRVGRCDTVALSAKPNSRSCRIGRHDQRDRQPPVAADLVELLQHQGAQAVTEQALDETCVHGLCFHLHAGACSRHASDVKRQPMTPIMSTLNHMAGQPPPCSSASRTISM